MEMRLQRFLAQAGMASRRKAEELIAGGRVQVNGRVVTTPGTKVDPASDKVSVDGRRVLAEAAGYVVLCKPRGYVTTVSDPQGRPTVMDLVTRTRGEAHRLYPVGRLDFHTDGVLLLTNDGDLANKLMHPRGSVAKVYHAKLRGAASEATLDRLRAGVVLDDGVRTRPAEVMRVRETDEGGHTWVQITIRQGLNRQIHRMGEAIAHPVLKLSRVAYGPLTAEGLRPGEWRPLSADEIEALRLAVRGTAAAVDDGEAPPHRSRRELRRDVRGHAVGNKGGGGRTHDRTAGPPPRRPPPSDRPRRGEPDSKAQFNPHQRRPAGSRSDAPGAREASGQLAREPTKRGPRFEHKLRAGASRPPAPDRPRLSRGKTSPGGRRPPPSAGPRASGEKTGAARPRPPSSGRPRRRS